MISFGVEQVPLSELKQTHIHRGVVLVVVKHFYKKPVACRVTGW